MNVVDSSAWLEYFANGSNASFFARAIEQVEELLVPIPRALHDVDTGCGFQGSARRPVSEAQALKGARANHTHEPTGRRRASGLPGALTA